MLRNDIEGSCEGCMYLCGDGTGYSDWTWMDTHIVCTLNNNQWLNDQPYEMPMDWDLPENALKRLAIFAGMRCHNYERGEFLVITPDGNLNADKDAKDLPRKQLMALAQFRYGDDDFYNPREIVDDWIKGDVRGI